jgi:beta-xylosidase
VSVLPRLTLVVVLSAAAASAPPPWSPDNGDGTYKNPVLFADYSDPDVVRGDDGYYLVSSSFNCVPGIPVLFSKDLVNWTIVAHAVARLPSPSFDTPQLGKGIWAPSIRRHDGWYWVYYGDPDLGIFMTKARNPRGPWTPLVHVREVKGWIDPTPLWDDDGKAYLVHAWAKSRAGINSILTVNAMSRDGTRLFDDGRLVFDGHAHHPTIEGPKFYKRGGFYYIFAPAGGVELGWQTVLRSQDVYGPYEDRIVMDRGSTAINGPHQGGWVEAPDGSSWFLHFQDRDGYGRVVHLQPMSWKDGWPVIGDDPDGLGRGQPVPTWHKPTDGSPAVPATSDEFDSKSLGLQWQWNANPMPGWASLVARPGWLRLNAVPSPGNLREAPNLLGQKFPAPAFTVTTKVEPRLASEGQQAGLAVVGPDYAYLALRRHGATLDLVKVSCRGAESGKPELEEARVTGLAGALLLRVKVAEGASTEFSYSRDGARFETLGAVLVMRKGGWMGARVCLFAGSPQSATGAGHADFDWLRVEP